MCNRFGADGRVKPGLDEYLVRGHLGKGGGLGEGPGRSHSILVFYQNLW